MNFKGFKTLEALIDAHSRKGSIDPNDSYIQDKKVKMSIIITNLNVSLFWAKKEYEQANMSGDKKEKIHNHQTIEIIQDLLDAAKNKFPQNPEEFHNYFVNETLLFKQDHNLFKIMNILSTMLGFDN